MTKDRRERLSLVAIAGAFVCSLVAGPMMTEARQAESCQLEPVSLPLFDGTPAADIAATPPSSDERTVDSSLENEILGAVEIIVGCSNADDPALRYAVFTDRYLATLFLEDQPADQPAFERMIASGSAVIGEPMELADVSDIAVADDGRVMATLTIITPNRTFNDRLLLAWSPSSATWLVDGIVELDPPVPEPGNVT